MEAQAIRQVAGGVDRIVVFADDWGRHPSSCQHLVRQLLPQIQVAWVNTIGTRVPTLSPDLIRRGFGKVLQWGGSRAQVKSSGPAPQVLNPLMYPGFRGPVQRKCNAKLLARFLRRRLGSLANSVVVSAIPIVADLPDHLDARAWVYYCVDDFSAWPGLDAVPLQTMEYKFVQRADRIIAAGENLAQRIRSMGRTSEVITHGVDLEHWAAGDGDARLFAGLTEPIVLFWGLVDRRLDVACIRKLDEALDVGTIAIVGPQQNPDSELARMRHVRLLGPASYNDLPALAARAAVLVMPYADLPVTRAMQPLKMREYLATGRPVVATSLPAVAPWRDCLDEASTAEQFVAHVTARLNGAVPHDQLRARERLADESWRAKATRFAEIVLMSEKTWH